MEIILKLNFYVGHEQNYCHEKCCSVECCAVSLKRSHADISLATVLSRLCTVWRDVIVSTESHQTHVHAPTHVPSVYNVEKCYVKEVISADI